MSTMIVHNDSKDKYYHYAFLDYIMHTKRGLNSLFF